jgi:hypothetical protein
MRLPSVFLRAALFTATLYAILWLIASLWIGNASHSIDTVRGESDIYRSDLREFVYGLLAFCESAKAQKNLIIVGGSTAEGYEPDVLSRFVPDWTVSRVALNFGNITQMRQSVALLRNCLGPEAMRNTRIGLAVSDPSFAPNKRRFPTPYTMLELEQLRHGLFAGPPGHLQPVVGWSHMGLVMNAIRPVFILHALVTNVWEVAGSLKRKIGIIRQGHLPKPTQEQVEAESLRYGNSLIGPSLDEQRSELAGLLDDIRAAGSDMFLIQVPERRFVLERLPQHSLFTATLQQFARDKDVALLQHPADDSELRDAVHATRDGASRWSERLGPQLAPMLARKGAARDALGTRSINSRTK